MTTVTIAPTLRTMSSIYRLSREGGPASERFRAYVARVEDEWGLSAYNPMSGSAALEAVDHLLALDWAIERAMKRVDEIGAADALREECIA